MIFEKGARPIKNLLIKQHYHIYNFSRPTLESYVDCWVHWLTHSGQKTLLGLDKFVFRDYTQGTGQAFDHFVLRHAGTRTISAFRGDFQYHACISKRLCFEYLNSEDDLTNDHALIISVPFSGLGKVLPIFDDLMHRCKELGIPVCLDLAYWGIAKNVHINLADYPCVTEVVSSLSKPFYTLENHRVGIRFAKNYLDDGISMINEVNMQNFYSMGLGIHYMEKFNCDWNWNQHSIEYRDLCQTQRLQETDTVIFGLSDDPVYKEFGRGVPGNYRLCLSQQLSDIT
jgi:hypothetical protein